VPNLKDAFGINPKKCISVFLTQARVEQKVSGSSSVGVINPASQHGIFYAINCHRYPNPASERF